jgi:hypothetical protein
LQGLSNPVVAAAALIALLLVIGADEAVGALVILAHEGPHALVTTLAGRRVESLKVTAGFSGVTRSIDRGCGPGRILRRGTDDTSDAAKLARDTLIPRRIWKLFVIAVAVVSLWGAIPLLAP